MEAETPSPILPINAANPSLPARVVKRAGWSMMKMTRGLFAERKDGGWEMSTGRVAFWLILGHCMWVWHKLDPAMPGQHMDVSAGELNTLWALLGYSGLKVASETITTLKTGKSSAESNG